MRLSLVKRLVTGIVAVFLLLGFSASVFAIEKKPVDVGDFVPNFQGKTFGDKPISFDEDIKGKKDITVIFFMTTACSACFQELKDIDRLTDKYEDRLGIWAVAVDLRGEKTVKPYAETYKFRVNYILDPKFKLPRLFGFAFTPSFVVVDKEGRVLYKKGGFTAGEDVRGIIKKFIK